MTTPDTRLVEGYGDMVAAPHHLAASAGIETLAHGGSAVDAAIAIDAVLGVVAPETCGIGGDLFALVAEPGGGTPACLNASGPAGSGADPEALRAAGHTRMPDFHPDAVTIPGCVAGWAALHERYGRLGLEDVLRPAIRLATDGFAVSTELADALGRAEEDMAPQASATGLYPGGRAPAVGDRAHRPGLAATLRGLLTSGLGAFYSGRIAEEISAAVDGRIAPEDLESFAPEWVEPVAVDVFGLTGWTIPLNSQGYLSLGTAAVFEMLEPPSPQDPEWTHLLVEAYRALAWQRDDVVSDPTTAELSARALVDPVRLRDAAAEISRDRAGMWPVPRPVPGGTAYMCAIDADGLAISLIQSNFMGIGSRIGAGEAGFFLHNRGAGFDLRAGHPNELHPGRRPLHTLSPSLWTERGAVRALLGTRGGHQQPQLMAQLAVRLFREGDDVARAQAAPRWTTDAIGPGAEPIVAVESRTPPEVVSGLQARGHTVNVSEDLVGGWGPVSAILVGENGRRSGAPDPRVDTTSVLSR
jgi:gamma-glutamyltranspeptidase / glutathione hydrolase